MRNPAGRSAIPAKKARPACLSSATAMAATGLFRKVMWKPVRARKRPPCARCAKKRARRCACVPGYREVTTYSPAKGVTKDVVFFVAEITGGTLRAQPEEVRASLPAAAGGSTAPADLCRRQGIAGKGKKYDSGRKKRLTTVFDYDNIYDALQKRSGMRC